MAERVVDYDQSMGTGLDLYALSTLRYELHQAIIDTLGWPGWQGV